MCFWQRKSRILNKWSWNERGKKGKCKGSGIGLVTLMAEVGHIKHRKSTEKRAIYECRQKIMV